MLRLVWVQRGRFAAAAAAAAREMALVRQVCAIELYGTQVELGAAQSRCCCCSCCEGGSADPFGVSICPSGNQEVLLFIVR